MLLTAPIPSENSKMNITEKSNELIVLVFYGTSCMGKTELVRFIKEKSKDDGIWIQDVSKDVIARPMIDAYHKEHPEVLYENIYMGIFEQVAKVYWEQTFRALDKLKPGKNIVVLDDPWADSKLVHKILENSAATGYKKRVICAYPKIAEKRLFMDLPFSLQFIVNLVYRVMERKEHQTMIYDDVKKVQIVLSFLRMYAGIKDIPTKFAEELPAHEYASLEFHQEKDTELIEADLPAEIKDVFNQVKTCFETMGAPFESPFVTGKENFVKLTELVDKLLQDEAHTKLSNFINYARKSEWEKWYNTCLKGE